MNEITNNIELLGLTLSNASKSIELGEVYITINVYEDLFSPFKTGKLIILDTEDLQQLFPLVGGEDLAVNFKSKNDKTAKYSLQQYKIYKLEKDSKTYENVENRKMLILYFCSPEYLIDLNTSISKKFYNTPSATIQSFITDIYKSKKEFSFDPAPNKVELFANFWKPTDCISYLSKKTNVKSVADFVFYENKFGFNFKSLNILLGEEYSHELITVDGQEVLYGYDSIRQFQFNKYYNLIDAYNNGTLGNTVYGVDATNYQHTKSRFNPITVTKHSTSLGKKVQFDSSLLGYSNTMHTFIGSDTVAIRDQILKAFSNYHLVVKLTGDSTKTVGLVVKINFRQFNKENVEDNTIFSGNWLITNINHVVTRGGKYEQNIKLIKNSFLEYKEFETVLGKKNP